MEQTKRCSACGHAAGTDAKFCPNCGGSQFYASTVHCPVCGADVQPGRYCAHCGADLQNPGAQVWRICGNCGNPVHISHTKCMRCGAAYVPSMPQRPQKKRSNAWLALLLIPVVLMLLGGICVGVLEYLDNGFPQMNAPHTTVWQDPDRPTFNRPTQPDIPRPTARPTQPWPENTEPLPTETEPEPTSPAQPKPTEPKPTVPKPTEPKPTEPKPTEPKPMEPADNIPTLFQDNYYLSCMGDGYCETMTGEMVVVFLFVNDPTDGWTDSERAEAEPALLNQLRTLLDEANSYGAELNIRYVFTSVTIQSEFNRNSNGWKEEAMTNVGFAAGYQEQWTLEAYYEANNVPVVFLVDEPGRSYATSYRSGKGFESLVICEKDYAALRHEMCHVFGAEDMYFPQVTTDAAKEYLPNGIMYGDCEGNVDALTAFVIGWTDVLTDEAISFLWATNDLTAEDIEEARAQDQLTGYGTKYFDGGHYTGWMVGGTYHGEGTIYWDDGTTYTGSWVNGQRDGYGELTSAAGYSYKGYWKNSDFHGTGTYTWPDGSVYTGAWVNNQRHGYGELYSADGFSYKGDWKDDKRNGTGTATYSNGGVYTGEWANGERHGQGTMTWTDGSYYTGAWKNGTQDGKGEYYYAKYGTKYVGDFVGGKRHGWGTYYYADGTTYTGRWENDARVD